jgi:hypothetical protein
LLTRANLLRLHASPCAAPGSAACRPGQYRSLTTEQRHQFLQAGAKWQEAMIHWQERPTLSFALMVIACEALKPIGADDRLNGLHVIEALLDKQTADRLRQNAFSPQRVRSRHTGEFLGSELILMAFTLTRVTPASVIQWLKRRGTYAMARVKPRRRT